MKINLFMHGKVNNCRKHDFFKKDMHKHILVDEVDWSKGFFGFV